jgi:hypothetical protein
MPFKDPEKRKEYRREYVRKNKERLAEHNKTYRENNKDKITEYNKIYDKTPAGIKSKFIRKWKSRGVISNNFDTLYDLYINTDKCMNCEKSFADSFERCLDHDHKTGLYRAVLCRSCNNRDSCYL